MIFCVEHKSFACIEVEGGTLVVTRVLGRVGGHEELGEVKQEYQVIARER